MATQISPTSFTESVLNILKDNQGVIPCDDLADQIYSIFEDRFTEADLSNIGKRNYPRWKNSLDWCKSMLCRDGLTKVWVSDEAPIIRWLVLLDDSITDPEIVKAVYREIEDEAARVSFAKLCPSCKGLNPMGNPECPRCGHEFKPADKRQVVKP